jgi:hypothetical protein
MKNPFRALWQSQSHLETLRDYLMRLRKVRASLEASGPQREARLVSVLQRVVLLLFDCLVLFEDLKDARDVERQRVYARVFAVLAVDAFDYLGNPLGPSGAELVEIADAAQLEKPLVASRTLLAAFHRKHESFLREVRNNLIAHTGADGEEQMRLLDEFDLGRAIDAFEEFLAVLTQTQLDLGDLLDMSGTAPADRVASS